MTWARATLGLTRVAAAGPIRAKRRVPPCQSCARAPACGQPNPEVCDADAIPFCLIIVNETAVSIVDPRVFFLRFINAPSMIVKVLPCHRVVHESIFLQPWHLMVIFLTSYCKSCGHGKSNHHHRHDSKKNVPISLMQISGY